MSEVEKKSGFLDTRRVFFFSMALLLAALPTFLFVDLMIRAGYTNGVYALSILYAVLMMNIAWGATHSLVGFSLRRGSPVKREAAPLSEGDSYGSVAIVLPVYNEDPKRVFAGLEAMFLSLERTGLAERFDFFVLSDSNRSESWIREEHAWARLCRDHEAFGRINYRRREVNTDKKAGNLLEFCESWGSRYRYMITLDADSILFGDTVVELYRRMEADPGIGILQTAPKIVYASSFWGRLQQFANHFYGPVFAAGLNFWQKGEGNYWGHNAIIRMAPFMEYCALPDLPGREPFGGKILSHDFVEAALMQRAGWRVELADDLGGTYEECPQDIIEHAKRDRRWCQGNMQHVWLLFSKGLKAASRIHIANGIMGYASSLIWAVFLVIGGIFVFNRVRSRLSILPIEGMGGWHDMDLQTHSLLVTGITFSLLFLTKILALIDAALTRGRANKFGGIVNCAASVLVESLMSALTAPILMIYHAKFVIFTAFGKGVGWASQKRDAGQGIGLSDAIRAHGVQSVIGVAATVLASRVNESFFYWTLPVSGSLAIAPLVSWMASKSSIGRRLRGIGILVIEEELRLPRELEETKSLEKRNEDTSWLFVEGSESSGFMAAIVDPYLNAIRSSMASTSEGNKALGNSIHKGRAALTQGPESLSEKEKEELLKDSLAMLEVHRLAWLAEPETIHRRWKPCFSRYLERSYEERLET